MHSRHRSPGDRSGGAGAAHSGYRNFGRGGYRRSGGQPKPSSYPAPAPAPPRRRDDVLLEAGRLAAEYLVAKGLLPAGALPTTTGPRWVGEDGGEGGRTSALSRLGRRRFDDEEAGFEGRNHKGRGGRRRHRNGSYNRHGSEWGRENGRGGPWPDGAWGERGRGYSDSVDVEELDRPRRWNERGREFLDAVDGDDSDQQGRHEEDSSRGGSIVSGKLVSKAAATHDQPLPSKSEVAGELESEPESDRCAPENCSKAMEVSESKKDSVAEANENLKSNSDDVSESELSMEEAGELKDSIESVVCVEEQMKNGLLEEPGIEASQACPATDDKLATNQGVNLLSLCGFAKVPTKPRSSVANRSPQSDQTTTEAAKDTNGDTSTEGVFRAKAEEVPVFDVSSDTPTDQPPSPRGLASEISTHSTSSDSPAGQPQSPRDLVPEVPRSQSTSFREKSVEHDLMSSIEGRCTRSRSFPDSSFVHQQQETNEGPPGFELSGEVFAVRIDEDLSDHVKREGMKRPREWSLSLKSQADVYFRNSRAKPSDLPAEKILPDHEMVDAVEDGQLRYADSFSKDVVDSHNNLEKEAQLASSSFKICDLNLMEAPEVTDNPNDPVLEHIPTATAPLTPENNLSVDFGLSIGQRGGDTGGYGNCSTVDKVVPVIDVDDDSPVQVISCDTSKTGTEPVYPNLENFLNHSENPVDLPDIQDGYSLAISDFLGNDITGCGAVQGDIGNLQAGMPFHGAEGITGVDDPLYVALGELPLPIGFMDVWDQPPPEYGKFF